MQCLRCNTQNEDGTKFCKNCGKNVTDRPSNHNTNSKFSDTLLIIFLALTFFSALAQFAIQTRVDNWYEGPTKYIQASLWILQNLSFILVPLSIKDTTLKIVGLIFTAVMIIYWIYGNVEFMTR